MSQEQSRQAEAEGCKSLKALRKSPNFIDRWKAARMILKNGGREISLDYSTRFLDGDEAFCFRCGHRLAAQELPSVHEIDGAEAYLPLGGFFCETCDWLWCRRCITRKDKLGRPVLMDGCPTCGSELKPATISHGRALGARHAI